MWIKFSWFLNSDSYHKDAFSLVYEASSHNVFNFYDFSASASYLFSHFVSHEAIRNLGSIAAGVVEKSDLYSPLMWFFRELRYIQGHYPNMNFCHSKHQELLKKLDLLITGHATSSAIIYYSAI